MALNEHLTSSGREHSHVFLGEGHAGNERRTWIVIALCGVMMLAEIVGGTLFGSLALVADGLHMSTHAGALLLAALAYTFSRKYAHDRRFSFGTGKLGDLAGFTSAVVLAMIALLIGYEAVMRFLSPVPIHFAQAIPIAVVGLGVNVVSAWLLSGGGHHHHGHGHDHGEDDHEAHDEVRRIQLDHGALILEIFEEGVPPRFRVRFEDAPAMSADLVSITTTRPGGAQQTFALVDHQTYLESSEEIPEPHAFEVRVVLGPDGSRQDYSVSFDEHDHAPHTASHRDNNMRAAVVHVIADAAVSVLVIIGLVLARVFGWLWMDPLAGLIGACVIASWSFGLIRDTGAILLDMTPDPKMDLKVRRAIEAAGDRISDFHLWRLGPGHLGAILCVETSEPRGPGYYHELVKRVGGLSHLTVEVNQPQAFGRAISPT